MKCSVSPVANSQRLWRTVAPSQVSLNQWRISVSVIWSPLAHWSAAALLQAENRAAVLHLTKHGYYPLRNPNDSGAALPIDHSATLAGFNQNLVRASLSLGETPFNTFRRITLPVIAPGVISGALFAFATSFDEVVVTLFLAGPDQVTLPRQMFTGIRENISPTIAAVATLLIVFTTALLLALEWLRGRRT